MQEQPPISTGTRKFQVIPGGREDDATSMKDLGKPSRKTAWQDAVRVQLCSLNDLPADWDGYGARSIPSDTVLFAFQVLNEIWMARLPVPDISPMSNEGLMIEWHTQRYEFTLEINGPYEMCYLFEDSESEALVEGSVPNNLEELDTFLRRFVDTAEETIAAA
jgi:hypothetical protein